MESPCITNLSIRNRKFDFLPNKQTFTVDVAIETAGRKLLLLLTYCSDLQERTDLPTNRKRSKASGPISCHTIYSYYTATTT